MISCSRRVFVRRSLCSPLAALFIAGFPLGPAAPDAHAATAVFRSGSTLYVNAAAFRINVVDIARSGGAYVITESGGDTVSVGNGCIAAGATSASCAASGIATLAVWVGDGDDAVTKSAAVPAEIAGGSGNDKIDAGPAWAQTANRLLGDSGADKLTGGPNADILDGGSGADLLEGGDGHDRVEYVRRAAAVTVTIDGVADDGEAGERDDVGLDVEEVLGGDGPDALTGGPGDDRLSGGPGADVLRGLAGGDTLSGGPGADAQHGGDGNDTFVATHLDGSDAFAGGSGALDHVSYAARSTPVRVGLDGVADDGAPGEGDDVGTDVEQVTGGAGADALTGGASADVLVGGLGADTLGGGGGDDRLRGGPGGGVLDGGDGDDLLQGGAGQDGFRGGPGRDRVDYSTHPAGVTVALDGKPNDGYAGEYDDVQPDVEDVTGGAGGDTLKGSPAANRLDGGGGDDALVGAEGADVLSGGPGADGLDAVDGVPGNDTLNGQAVDKCSSDPGDTSVGC